MRSRKFSPRNVHRWDLSFMSPKKNLKHVKEFEVRNAYTRPLGEPIKKFKHEKPIAVPLGEAG
jgi:hypothetical protein